MVCSPFCFNVLLCCFFVDYFVCFFRLLHLLTMDTFCTSFHFGFTGVCLLLLMLFARRKILFPEKNKKRAEAIVMTSALYEFKRIKETRFSGAYCKRLLRATSSPSQ